MDVVKSTATNTLLSSGDCILSGVGVMARIFSLGGALPRVGETAPSRGEVGDLSRVSDLDLAGVLDLKRTEDVARS